MALHDRFCHDDVGRGLASGLQEDAHNTIYTLMLSLVPVLLIVGLKGCLIAPFAVNKLDLFVASVASCWPCDTHRAESRKQTAYNANVAAQFGHYNRIHSAAALCCICGLLLSVCQQQG